MSKRTVEIYVCDLCDAEEECALTPGTAGISPIVYVAGKHLCNDCVEATIIAALHFDAKRYTSIILGNEDFKHEQFKVKG